MEEIQSNETLTQKGNLEEAPPILTDAEWKLQKD